MGPGVTRSREETAGKIQEMDLHWQAHGFGMWAAVDPSTGTLLGRGGLAFLDGGPEVEVGYLIDRQHWGKGLATELAAASLKFGFERVGLDRIAGITYPENLASQRVLEKIGMRYERDDVFYGVLCRYYALDRPEESRPGKG